MHYETVSKPKSYRSSKTSRRALKQKLGGTIDNRKLAGNEWETLDVPEPLESWSIEDFNDLVPAHFG